MNRPVRKASFSKISVKSQTVIPSDVRATLGIKPGDVLRYRITSQGVVIDKAPMPESDDPFAEFTEWTSAADEKAFADF